LEINLDRATKSHYDIYETDNFTPFIAGATLLGRDIKRILSESTQTLETSIGILQTELNAQEESKLINQILETHGSLKYEEVFDGLQNLLNQLRFT